ncbi:hypothetical protein ACFL2U_01520 [Patescibacteria group bacterium]
MTIWQKRVLIFFTKIIGAIIIIAVIALFLYYNLYFKKDTLLKYAPKNSIAYAAFRINNSLLDNQAINSFVTQVKEEYDIDLAINILNPLVGYNAALAVIPNNENFDYLLILDLKPGIKEFTELEQILIKNNWFYEQLTHDVIEKNILIISNATEVINQVKKINVQEAQSLADRVDVVLNLKSMPISNQGKMFLDLQVLKELINQTENLGLKLALANFNVREVYLNIKQTENKVIVKSYKHDTNSNKQIISEKVPQDYVYNVSLSQANIDLASFVEKLYKIDKNTANFLTQYTNYYQQLYKFDLQADILDLFANQAQFTITQDKDWLIIANLAEITDFESKISQIDHIIKEHLAYNNPVEIEKQMPDKTYIRQIIKQTNVFEFISQDIKGIDMNYLQKNGEEYAYFVLDEMIYLANNREILTNLLNDQDITSLAENSECYDDLPNFSQNIIVNSLDNIEKLGIYDYFQRILLSQQEHTNEIWLCLE